MSSKVKVTVSVLEATGEVLEREAEFEWYSDAVAFARSISQADRTMAHLRDEDWVTRIYRDGKDITAGPLPRRINRLVCKDEAGE